MTPSLPTGNAICYSGYREGQSPDRHLFPSVAQIREDLHLLAPHWQLLRLYDCSPHAERVLQVIAEDRLHFRVLLGVNTLYLALVVPAGAQAQFRPRLGTFVWMIW